jgi:PAS domain S-box-containing protein
MNAFDPWCFESSISDTDARITDSGHRAGFPDLPIDSRLPPSCNFGVGFFPAYQLAPLLADYESNLGPVSRTHQRARSFVPVGNCDRSARSICITASQLCWRFVFVIVICFRCPSLLGQMPPSGNMQVDQDSWTFKDGAPADVVCLAQTNDGFLWLGTSGGLFRFDGTRFEPFSSPFGDRLLSTNLYSLFAPPSGGLWIGYTLGGFSFLDKGRMTNYPSETGGVGRFAQDRDGIVWAGTTSGLWRFDHSEWQHIGDEWNAPAGPVVEVGFDSEGILWALVGGFAAPKDLVYLMPGTKHFKIARRNLSVEAFTWEPDQTILTAPVAPRVSRSGEGSVDRLPAYPISSKNLQMVDRNNGVWVSPWDTTVVERLPKDSLRDATNIASMAGSETYDINPYRMAELVDREGNVWFGDSRGVHRFFYTPLIRQEVPKEISESSDFAVVADDKGAVWISFNNGNTLKADLDHVLGSETEHRLPQVTSSFAYRAPDKTLWFSGKGCLWHLVGKDFIRVNLPPEMVNLSVFLQTIAEDQQGGIWISFGRHSLYRLAHGIWTPYGGRNDLPKTGRIMVAFTDSLGRVWFGNVNGHLEVLDGNRVHLFGPNNGLQVGAIQAIHGRGSAIWIGGEFGLEQIDQGRFHKIAAVNNQWLRGISGIVETANGDLWLNGISGIFHIRKAEIAEALENSAYRVQGEHFGRREGLSGVASQVHPLPTAIEGTDGRLWFTFRNGVVWLNPAAYSQKRPVPPPITIQSISADDKFFAPDSRLSLPAHKLSVQISYAAVSLSDPEAIRIRYKLDETDKDWHEVAEAAPITYRNLPPGSYHFTVEASDTNGAWSGAPASMAFTILPAFYQTIWFRLLCVAAFLLFLWELYRLRVQQLRGEERKLREAIETIPAMAWIAGPDGTVQFVNRRWVEYTGLSQLGKVGKVGEVAIHPEDLDRSKRRLGASFASGELFEDEMRFRRTDGEYRWFLSRAVPLRDNRGKVVKWYGAATDIQDRKRAEELQAELAHTNRVSTMGELVASISHDLAQPITVTTANARASLRWLQHDPPDLAEVRTGTERIMEAGSLAAEIINRLRSLYKKSYPKRELVTTNEVIGEMILLLRCEANEHGVSIRTELAADLPKITADRVQLQQVLMNLMLNGIEAMKETGGVLTVKTGRGESAQVLVSISDMGVGLPTGKTDEIFNAFFTTKPQGSGMGLAISRSIVESHGGHLWATANDGRAGATFHFTLPTEATEPIPPANSVNSKIER